MKHVYYHVRNELPVYVQCRIQDAWVWCTVMIQRDDMGRVVGGGFRIGNSCTPVADSCQCMAKPIQYCKVKNKEKKKERKKESIIMNKASGGDGIPTELFQILKDDAVQVLHSTCQHLENIAVATGLEKVSFHSNPKERQFQRMLNLPHNCTHLTR